MDNSLIMAALDGVNNRGLSIREAHRQYGVPAGISWSTFLRRIKKEQKVVSPISYFESTLARSGLRSRSLKKAELIRLLSSDIYLCSGAGVSKKKILEVINRHIEDSISYTFFCRLIKVKRTNAQQVEKKSINEDVKQRIAKKIVGVEPGKKGTPFLASQLEGCDFLSEEEKGLLLSPQTRNNVIARLKAIKKYRAQTELND